MYGHPHLSPMGYTRPPSPWRRAVRSMVGTLGVISLGVAMAVPWWVGVAALLGAW